MKKILPALLLATAFTSSAQTLLLDETFSIGTGTNFAVTNIEKLPGGKIMIGGNFDFYNGVPAHGLARINPDGTLDTTFNAQFEGNLISDFVAEEDGKITAVSEFGGIMRFNPDGSVDTTFSAALGIEVASVARQGDKYIVSGNFIRYSPEGVMYQNLIRLNNNGSIDGTFATTAFYGFSYAEIMHQEDGKLLLTGTFTYFHEEEVNHIVRLNADGSRDESFNAGTGSNGWLRGAAQQPDGKYIITGNFNSFNGQPARQMVRLNNDGSLDDTFAYTTNIGLQEDGIIGFDIAFEGDGKILIAGRFGDAAIDIEGVPDGSIPVTLVRLNTDGSNDETFSLGEGFNDTVYAVKLVEDFSTVGLYVGGQFTQFNDSPQNNLARLLENVLATDNHSATNISVYPNPAEERLFVSMHDGDAMTVKLTDVMGKVVKSSERVGHNGIDISHLLPGLYFAEITIGNRAEIKKIIKK